MHPLRALIVALALLTFLLHPAGGSASEEESGLETRSERPFVHRINLYAEDGRVIDPHARNAPVFSNDATCGKCHDVAAVAQGWHFNAPSLEADHGRRGEPWFLIDEATGTQIPVSYRGWPGTWTPESLDLSPQDFITLFGRHLPGGGIGDPRHRDGDSDDNWDSTGNLEIDCMVCHSVSPNYDPLPRIEQIDLGNYRYVSVVAMGLGTVKGSSLESASTATSIDDAFAEFDPAMEEGEKKAVVDFIYNISRFDEDNRTLFELVGEIPSTNCLFCHTNHVTQSSDGLEDWQRPRDVHLEAGLSCVDCHSNGIDHNIVRGFEGETIQGALHGEMFTCRGCHMGTNPRHATDVTANAGGLGSPIPGHHGIPLIHFETMSCTSCHSGPMPDHQTTILQTSMAHGLGVPRFERAVMELPYIVQPIFIPDQVGKLAPHKAVWPSYFGVMDNDGTVTPLSPDQVRARVSIDSKQKPPIDPGIIAKTLKELQENGDVAHVYVSEGQLHRLENTTGELASEEHPAAQPYTWPLAHDVRPAGQSIGARSCQECHSPEAPFLFSKVSLPLVLQRPEPLVQTAFEFSGLDSTLNQRFAQSFAIRPLYKVALALAILLTGLALLAAIVGWLIRGVLR